MAIDMTVVLIAFFFIILSIYFSTTLNTKAKAKALKQPPGPRKLPIIGNLHQIGLALPQRALRDMARKYGPIMRVQIGQIPMIVVSTPRLAEQVLKTNDISLASRPYSLFADVLLYGGIDVAFGNYGDYWRQMKKLVTIELLSVKKVQSFTSFRKEAIDSLVEDIRSSCGSGKPVQVRKVLTKLNNTVVCKALFGNNCRNQEVLIEAMDEAMDLSGGYLVEDLFPQLAFVSVLFGTKSKFTKLHDRIDKIFEVIFEDRRIKRQTNGPSDDDLTDALFNNKERGGLPFPITDNNIKAIFMNMITGGTDTSTITTEWAMTELMRNPDVMAKAQTEVREVFKGHKTIIETELHKLVFLKQVIKETLRLHLTLPLLLPRECREPCQIDGYDIPVKTRVVVNAFACTTDPESWDDPDSFKPERFDKSSYDFSGTRFEYIPFGSGRRICPGISFSMISVEHTLAKLLYHFNWQLPNGLQPKDIDMTETFGGTTVKKDPLQVMATLHIPF